MEYTLFLEMVRYNLLFYHRLIKSYKTFFLIVPYKYRLYLHYNVMSRRFHLRDSHPPHDVMAVLLLLISQRDSRWAFSYSELGCWLPNIHYFQTFTLRLISSLCCSQVGFTAIGCQAYLVPAYPFASLGVDYFTPLRTSFPIRWLFRKRSLTHDWNHECALTI